MKLTELFPDVPQLTLEGKDYELKYAMRAILQLAKDYPEKMVNDKKITTNEQIVDVLNSGITGMKPEDMVNMLYAGLIYTKAFKTKDELIDVMEPCYFSDYISNILLAYRVSQMTPEQREKMEVMAATSKSKKKEPVSATTDGSTHSTGSNAE